MAFFSFEKFSLVLLITFCGFISNVKGDCYENTINYTIKSLSGSNLVLDARDPEGVTIQEFDGSLSQLFTVQCADRVGLFHIISQENGNRLSAEINSTISSRQLVVTTSPPSSSLIQSWFIKSRRRVANAGHIGVIDVLDGGVEADKLVILRYFNSESTQLWDLVEPQLLMKNQDDIPVQN